jgi:hypothetical protein
MDVSSIPETRPFSRNLPVMARHAIMRGTSHRRIGAEGARKNTMQLATVDWIVIVVSLAAAFAPAVFFARRASKGTAEFFASGRSAPWWLIGTSMVATTFSTDTPNLVTDFVRTNGVSQNWAWWAFLITGMMTVFFYARMWRRSGVLTDLEFYELRYSGKSAAFVRGFRAVYLGLFFNCAIMATVTLAAAKIANVMLGWSRLQTVLLCGVLCVVFAAMSGLWGVLASDMIQFVIAMVGVFAAAYVALSQPEVGGLAGLVAKVDRRCWWCRSRFSGGRCGIRAPSRAAAATSPSGCWRPRTSATRWPRRCGSTSRTTRCGRGPGSSSRCARCWCSRPWETSRRHCRTCPRT